MTEDITEIFAVVAEFKNQAPILMEMEGEQTSLQSARDRASDLSKSSNVLRTCVVRLEYESGNALLLHDLKRIQK